MIGSESLDVRRIRMCPELVHAERNSFAEFEMPADGVFGGASINLPFQTWVDLGRPGYLVADIVKDVQR